MQSCFIGILKSMKNNTQNPIQKKGLQYIEIFIIELKPKKIVTQIHPL